MRNDSFHTVMEKHEKSLKNFFVENYVNLLNNQSFKNFKVKKSASLQ